MRFEIVGIFLENVLRFEHGVADAAGLGIQFGQTRGQILRGRVGFNRQAVFLDGFVGEFAAAVHRNLLLVHVSQSVVIVSRGPIRFARSRLVTGLVRSGGSLLGEPEGRQEKHEKNSRMTCVSSITFGFPNHSDWMPNRCWWVLESL